MGREEVLEMGEQDASRELCATITAGVQARAELLLRSLFTERRDFFLYHVLRVIREDGLRVQTAATDADTRGWTGVESLSALRALVGGRFSNLKQKWVDAGLPLRSHRGDRSGGFQLNEKGWLELSSWMLNQGFEARLATSEYCLFEVRPVSPAGEQRPRPVGDEL